MNPKQKQKNKEKLSEDVPLLYLYVYKQMVEKFGHSNKVLSTKNILEVWRRCIHNVPRKYDYFIMKEMEGFGLIERFTNQKNCFYGVHSDEILKNLNRCDELAEILYTQKWKFVGSKANKKLQKLSDYFLW
jgi:hypothetical protein